VIYGIHVTVSGDDAMLAACTISRDVDLWVTSSSSSLFTIGLYCHFPADYGPALSQLTTLTAYQILERHNYDRYRHNLQRRLDVDLPRPFNYRAGFSLFSNDNGDETVKYHRSLPRYPRNVILYPSGIKGLYPPGISGTAGL